MGKRQTVKSSFKILLSFAKPTRVDFINNFLSNYSALK